LKIGRGGEYSGLTVTRYQGSGENYIMRSLMICTPHPINIKNNEIGGAVARMGEGRGV
jgi:hypothetical protein